MKQLLEHLISHRKTRDPWVLVFDSYGTFSDEVGNSIRIDNWGEGIASILNVNLRIFKIYPGIIEVRVRRGNLEMLIDKIKTIHSLQEHSIYFARR